MNEPKKKSTLERLGERYAEHKIGEGIFIVCMGYLVGVPYVIYSLYAEGWWPIAFLVAIGWGASMPPIFRRLKKSGQLSVDPSQLRIALIIMGLFFLIVILITCSDI